MLRIFVILIVCFFSPIMACAEQGVEYKLSYFQQKKEPTSIDNILNEKFKKIPNSHSLGFENGDYWFKLTVDQYSENSSYVIYVPTHNISKIDLYQVNENQMEFVAHSGNRLQREDLNVDYKFPAFRLEFLETGAYYFKVHFPKEANFPLKIKSENEFFKDALFNQSIIFLYYGTCLMILIVNLFFYWKFRNRIFLYYSIFLFSMTGGMLLYDGTLINLQRIVPLGTYFEFIFRLLECSALILFSVNFLDLKNRTPRFIKLIVLFPLLMVISYLLYSISDNYMFVAVGDVIGISVFLVLWLLGIGIMKKHLYAKFFVLGYALILPVGAFYFFGYGFGWWHVDGEDVIVKMAGWFDMIIFTYALSIRMKVKEDENKEKIKGLKVHIDEIKIALTSTSNEVDPYFIFLKKNDFTSEELTLREIDVLKCLHEGMSNANISEKLFISGNTVKTHIRKIYNKLDIKSRKELTGKMTEFMI